MTVRDVAGGGFKPIIEFFWSNDGSDFSSLVADAQPAGTGENEWIALAVDKDSTGKIRIYLDGEMIASDTPADTAFHDSAALFMVGNQTGGGFPLCGWIDEIRITKGVAHYASDDGYEVATEPFPRS